MKNYLLMPSLLILLSSSVRAEILVNGVPVTNVPEGDRVIRTPVPAATSVENKLIDCAQKTSAGLTKFRDSAIELLLKGDYNTVQRSLYGCYRDNTPACMNDLSYYLYQKRNPGRDNLGYTEASGLISDPVEGYTMKSVKDLPSEFLVKDSNGNTKEGYLNFPPDILKVAKEKKWKAVGYKTRSTGGFDAAPNLTLVAIPGLDKDVYLQISPPPDKNAKETLNEPYPESKDLSHGQGHLTVITVDKTQNPPVGQLRLMTYDSVEKAYKWNNSLQSRQCVTCHTTPLRSISPRGYLNTWNNEKRMKPEDEKTVTEINNMMLVPGLSWGSVRTGYALPTRRGPDMDWQPYGWTDEGRKTRQPDFVAECAKKAYSTSYQSLDWNYTLDIKKSDNPQVNHGKVTESMNCTQCHNNSVRGFLHERFSFEEIKFKVLVDKSMPPGQDLSQDERLALVACLREEMNSNRDVWKKSGSWLKVDDCKDEVPVRRQKLDLTKQPEGVR